jgi:hypothetical protein
MGPIRCPEKSVTDYLSTLRSIPKESRSRQTGPRNSRYVNKHPTCGKLCSDKHTPMRPGIGDKFHVAKIYISTDRQRHTLRIQNISCQSKSTTQRELLTPNQDPFGCSPVSLYPVMMEGPALSNLSVVLFGTSWYISIQ